MSTLVILLIIFGVILFGLLIYYGGLVILLEAFMAVLDCFIFWD